VGIDRIKVTGFKSIRELDLGLRPLNVLIGANGAGKTNFISLVTLLNRMVEGDLQLAVAQGGGADAFLHYGHATTPEIMVELFIGQNRYRSRWTSAAGDSFVFAEETCMFQKPSFSKPFEVSLGKGHTETRLEAEGPTVRPSVDTYVFDKLQSVRVYHFHDTSDSAKVKKSGSLNDNQYLRRDASNLAAFLYLLKKRHPKNYESIRNTVRLVAPFFDDFVLRPTAANEDVIRLEWREKGSDYPFLAHQLSDGTLRFACLATVLLQPHMPSTILIDEPELGLHPYAIALLAGLLRSASKHSQIIVSTQSVPLVNEFEPEDLLVVDRKDGLTTIMRPDPASLKAWLEEYSLAELWEKNILGGRPSR
jgi:predicted ATPase